jgi:hypothetical protein
MTALVEHDKFNPWGRVWWGGTPKGWADNIHTTRSGICLTKENYVGYFFGVDISAEVLAQGMLLARCAYGVHLDMNPGLAGFEFYNVQPATTWQPLGRKLQEDWEYEGTFKELPEFKYRARRMIKGMQEMNFPQYIHRDGRDFFYLTERPVLPGPELPAPIVASGGAKEAGEGAWRVKGLPQHGFPYALAIAWTRPDPSRPTLHVRAVRVDPRTVVPAGAPGTNAETPTVVSFIGLREGASAQGGAAPAPSSAKNAHDLVEKPELHAWFASGVFLIEKNAPSEDATPLAAGVSATSPFAKKARAAVGIQDEDGMLEWIELAPDVTPDASTAQLLDKLLEKAGCSSRMLILGDTRPYLGGTLDLAGETTAVPAGPAATVSRLVRGSAPGAHLAFESTPIVPPAVWQPLQSQRVRYFRKAAKAKPAATAADANAPAPTSEPSSESNATPSQAPAPHALPHAPPATSATHASAPPPAHPAPPKPAPAASATHKP